MRWSNICYDLPSVETWKNNFGDEGHEVYNYEETTLVVVNIREILSERLLVRKRNEVRLS